MEPMAPPEPSTRLLLKMESNTSTPPRRAYTAPPSSQAKLPGEDRANDGRSPLREDSAAGLLGEVLVHHRVHHHDLSFSRYRGTRSVVTTARNREVLDDEKARAVLAKGSLLEAGHPDRVSIAV